LDYTALKTEIQTDPTSMGYAALLPSCPGIVADKLNAISTAKCLKSRFVTARTIQNEVASGGAILKQLKSAAGKPLATTMTPQLDELQEALITAVSFLYQDSGVDVGTAGTQGLIDACVSVAVLTAAQGASLKAMGMAFCTRAEALGLGYVYESDLRKAGVV
jgi:hypothetical protein